MPFYYCLHGVDLCSKKPIEISSEFMGMIFDHPIFRHEDVYEDDRIIILLKNTMESNLRIELNSGGNIKNRLF